MLKSIRIWDITITGGSGVKKFDYNGRKNICGNRVRCLRTARRWSQAALAAKMQTQGVIMEQDVVSKIESGWLQTTKSAPSRRSSAWPLKT